MHYAAIFYGEVVASITQRYRLAVFIAAIELAARQHGVAHRVCQLGLIADHDVDALYRGADVFVMPNIEVPGDVEGFGVVQPRPHIYGSIVSTVMCLWM